MQTLCFDIGGTKIQAAVIDATGTLLNQKTVPTPTSSWNHGKAALEILANDYLRLYPNIQSCGIACAGPLDTQSGKLQNPTNLNWGHAPIQEEMSKLLNIPVALENDAASAVMGEFKVGQFKGKQSLAMIALGTGLGVGIINNGKIFRTSQNQHPEIGHQILNSQALETWCACGNAGCAEGYIAGSHFLTKTRELLFQPEISMLDILKMASLQDPIVMKQFNLYSLHLAQFIYNLNLVFESQNFVLAGGFTNAASYFLDNTFSLLSKWCTERKQPVPQIALTTLSNPALYGAWALAQETITD
ncbi:MAG: hypothetical protein A2622_09310 [Bdellovibrionales bacterium RIFCSPHIGHO2_01_FULL_40_29]|nr:MAG: hypothetical protein A2622_09310 [Bdellovibrionales bacterium RIFCSPHIGHO2_01_FULL_40_29]OFZ33578.1 MAG: hypothetical protein A3D17_00310 [Bdellovibrionales bacterium RIFCSPHIGHO2_02_FULL_40_15]